MATTTMTVPDISCEHCERTIKDALASTAGIQTVAVDIPAKRVRVTYDESRVNLDQIKEILRNEDYPVASAEPG